MPGYVAMPPFPYRVFFRTVVLVRIGFDAWCAAYGHMRNASMAIGNINAKIVNRTTNMCVVDSQCQYPFMVACLLNAVSLRGNTCITIVL